MYTAPHAVITHARGTKEPGPPLSDPGPPGTPSFCAHRPRSPAQSFSALYRLESQSQHFHTQENEPISNARSQMYSLSYSP